MNKSPESGQPSQFNRKDGENPTGIPGTSRTPEPPTSPRKAGTSPTPAVEPGPPKQHAGRQLPQVRLPHEPTSVAAQGEHGAELPKQTPPRELFDELFGEEFPVFDGRKALAQPTIQVPEPLSKAAQNTNVDKITTEPSPPSQAEKQQEELTPHEIISSAREKAIKELEEVYPLNYEDVPRRIEGDIAYQAARHVTDIAEDGLTLAEKWQTIPAGLRSTIMHSEQGEVTRVLDSFDTIVSGFEQKGLLGQGKYFFEDDMPEDERTLRIRRGVEQGFKAGIEALIPDTAATQTILSTYTWIDGKYQSVIPLEDSFETVLPNTRVNQITYDKWLLDQNTFETRTVLAFHAKHKKDEIPFDPRNN